MPSFFRIPERLHLGLMLMTELASNHEAGEALSLRVIAERMSVSDGYLEEISASLRFAKLIRGQTGPRGGYVLAKDPSKITIEEIIRAIEGPFELVACHGKNGCGRQSVCRSKVLWDFLQVGIEDLLKKKTLSELIS